LPAGSTVADCLASDPRGRIARAEERTVAAEARYCRGQTAEFGPQTATAGNAAFASFLDLEAIFGEDLDAALAGGPDVECRSAAIRAAADLAKRRVRALRSCVHRGLRTGAIQNAAGLHACLEADPRRAFARAEKRLARDLGDA